VKDDFVFHALVAEALNHAHARALRRHADAGDPVIHVRSASA
jgi:hypothetical protein